MDKNFQFDLLHWSSASVIFLEVNSGLNQNRLHFFVNPISN